MRSTVSCVVLMVALLASMTSSPSNAQMQVRGGAYAIRMEPEGADAKDFSKASWGGGLYLLLVPPTGTQFLAGVAGVDFVNMLSQTIEFRDRVTLLRIEQQTNQWYSRFYVGGRLGHQGHGFFRPYAGAALALNYYSISTDVVVPDDRDYEKEIRQHLEKQTEYAFGFDASLGIELNFRDVVYLDIGAKYLKSFSVPQQLGPDAEAIHPQYIEIVGGINIRFQ